MVYRRPDTTPEMHAKLDEIKKTWRPFSPQQAAVIRRVFGSVHVKPSNQQEGAA